LRLAIFSTHYRLNIRENLRDKDIHFLTKMIGNTRPTNKKRKTEIHRSLYKIFGPRWELE